SRPALPLPCARSAPPEGRPSELVRESPEDSRLTWSDVRIRHLKLIFASKGTRPCLVFPENWNAEPQEDRLHPGRQALRLAFELPKGSYATILVKLLSCQFPVPSSR